jgi:hypothetical protein
MNSLVSGTLTVLKRSAVFIGAIGLFFFADGVIGQTGGSRSTRSAHRKLRMIAHHSHVTSV